MYYGIDINFKGGYAMRMKEKNEKIVKEIRKEIRNQGLSDVLDVYPVENTFTRRRRYWTDEKVHLFKVHM